MTEPKLGTKHECQSCGTKFYDLGRPKQICPQCGTDQKAQEEEEASASAPAAAEPKP